MARTRIEGRELIPSYIRRQVLNDCGGICSHCGTKLKIGDNFTVEHVIPLNKGGKNDVSNYVALCETCNKSKSDDIVEPKDYYTYLPKERLSELQAMFEEYCKYVDWLGYDTLFKTDQFTLSSLIPVFKQRTFVNVPVTYKVERMRKEEFLEYSMMYRSRLSVDDKDLIPYDANELYLPYYRVMHNGDIIMAFSPYIAKADVKEDKPRNVLFVDFFCNPELKRKRNTVPMLYNLIQALSLEMQKTLTIEGYVTFMCYSFSVPKSDELGSAVLRELDLLFSKVHLLREQYQNPNNSGGCSLIFESFMFQGRREDLKNTIENCSEDPVKDMQLGVSLDTLQTPIDIRLQKAKELEAKNVPEKPKKKDKKASKKKKHHR